MRGSNVAVMLLLSISLLGAFVHSLPISPANQEFGDVKIVGTSTGGTVKITGKLYKTDSNGNWVLAKNEVIDIQITHRGRARITPRGTRRMATAISAMKFLRA